MNYKPNANMNDFFDIKFKDVKYEDILFNANKFREINGFKQLENYGRNN